MARFELWPMWQVRTDTRLYGWLVWHPGQFYVRDTDGRTLDKWRGPQSMAGTTQPSKTARQRAERVLGVPRP